MQLQNNKCDYKTLEMQLKSNRCNYKTLEMQLKTIDANARQQMQLQNNRLTKKQ